MSVKLISVINQFLDLNYLSLIGGQQENTVVYFRFSSYYGACEFMRLVKVFKPFIGAVNMLITHLLHVLFVSSLPRSKIIHCPPTVLSLQYRATNNRGNTCLTSCYWVKVKRLKHITPEPSLYNQLTLIEICTLTCFFNSKHVLVYISTFSCVWWHMFMRKKSVADKVLEPKRFTFMWSFSLCWFFSVFTIQILWT